MDDKPEKDNESENLSYFQKDLINRSIESEDRRLDSNSKNVNVLLTAISILLVAETSLYFGIIAIEKERLQKYLSLFTIVFIATFLFQIVPIFLVSFGIRPHIGKSLVSTKEIAEKDQISKKQYINAIDGVQGDLSKDNDERFKVFRISNLLMAIGLGLVFVFFLVLILALILG